MLTIKFELVILHICIALAIGAVMDINLSNEMTLRFTVIDISVVWNFSDISAVSKLLSYVDASTLRNSATVAQQLLYIYASMDVAKRQKIHVCSTMTIYTEGFFNILIPNMSDKERTLSGPKVYSSINTIN